MLTLIKILCNGARHKVLLRKFHSTFATRIHKILLENTRFILVNFTQRRWNHKLHRLCSAEQGQMGNVYLYKVLLIKVTYLLLSRVALYYLVHLNVYTALHVHFGIKVRHLTLKRHFQSTYR